MNKIEGIKRTIDVLRYPMPAWVTQKSPDKGLPGSSGPISTIGTTLPLTTSITMTPASRQDDAEMYRKLAERLMYQVEVLQ